MGSSEKREIKPVISINRSCLSHSTGQQNETVLRAFKMACLNYEPSDVDFENSLYKRSDLLRTKADLLRSPLLTELQAMLDKSTETIDLPSAENSPLLRPLPLSSHREYPSWLEEDSIESIQRAHRSSDHDSPRSSRQFNSLRHTQHNEKSLTSSQKDSPRLFAAGVTARLQPRAAVNLTRSL
jgi:hypothetical protein